MTDVIKKLEMFSQNSRFYTLYKNKYSVDIQVLNKRSI